jgi:hypothetical protein
MNIIGKTSPAELSVAADKLNLGVQIVSLGYFECACSVLMLAVREDKTNYSDHRQTLQRQQ